MRHLIPILLSLLLSIGCNSRDSDSPGSANAGFELDSTQPSPAASNAQTPLPATSDLGLPTQQIREAGKLYPVDEAPRDASFVTFRQNLLQALDQRDLETLLASLDPQIKIGFGGEGGREDFLKIWELKQKPRDSKVWQVLTEVLRGGGTWQEGSEATPVFVAPYVFASYEGEDPFSQSVITGEGVNVRASPSLQAKIVAQLSYDIVELAPDANPIREVTRIGNQDYGWTKLRLADGRTGYVSEKFVSSPVGYRAIMSKNGGKWVINAILAGD